MSINLNCWVTRKIALLFALLNAAAVGFGLQYVCLTASSSTNRWTSKKTNTQTRSRPPRDSSASANKHRMDSHWPGWWYDCRVKRAVVCQKHSTKQNKKNLCSGSAGRSHCERVIEMAVWHNQSECEVQLSCLQEGRCKQHSGSHALVAMQQHCFRSPAVHSWFCLWSRVTSTGSLSTCWGNLKTSTYRWGTV